MQNMINSVYDSLKTSTEDLAKKTKKLVELEALERSKIYSHEYLNGHIRPEMFALRREIEHDKKEALANAKGIVEKFQDELREKDCLNPADITQDAVLFTSGVKLKARDVEAILARNKGNRTMEQMALRFTQENNIDLGRKIYVGHESEIQEAGGVSRAVDYFGRWITEPNALAMLDRFFSTEGESVEE